MELLYGLVLLLSLVGYQLGMHRWKIHRLQQSWVAANAALQRNDLEEAEQAVGRCVKLEPLFVPARQLQGHVAALRGNHAMAEEAFKFAVALQPREGMGYFQLGLYYAQFRPQETAAALEALRQAVEHDPKMREMIAQHRGKFVALEEMPDFVAMLN